MTQRTPVAVHRQVARAASFVYLGLAAAMALCAGLGWAFEQVATPARPVDAGSVAEMMVCASGVGLTAVALWWWGRPAAGVSFSRREAMFAVNAIWFGAAILGAVPYVVDGRFSVVDGLFEAASGFTTTGATIVEDIEGTLSHTLLLWRSLTQWLGGMGIVVLFVAIFPGLGVSGKHMYRSEVPGHSAEGLQPRITETSLVLWRFYALFTLAEIGVLWWLGMSLFDAVNHAWTTMSTGGFSTRNASIAAFDSAAIEIAVSLFMFAAGANFALYYVVLSTGRLRDLFRSIEMRAYLGLIVVMTGALTLGIAGVHQDWLKSARYALFTVATTLTSTGFGVDDYMQYPPVSLLLILAMMLVGGMSGSTAGGIKVSRMVILLETAWAMIRRNVRPSVVHVVRLDNKVLDDDLLLEVATFFFLYNVALGLGTLGITLTDGVPVQTAFGAVLSSLSNMGPAPYWIEADNFARYSDFAKGLFSVAMILGRLELMTVLSLLLPDVWRR